MMEKRVLAIDLGASSGRAVLGIYNGVKLITEEVHRFPNEPVAVRGTLYWDILRLFAEIKNSLVKASLRGRIDSVAIDSWGVDFGLIGKDGELLENPVHYRDSRTRGMMERLFEKVPGETVYGITGSQFMEINTLFQLLSLKEKRAHIFEQAQTLLMVPDLLNYFLCGEKVSEESIASTTQLFDIKRRNWSFELIKMLGLPEEIFAPVVPGATVLGGLSCGICEELNIPPLKVVAVSNHDTQSVLGAVPAEKDDFMFLSCGTWSLLGALLDKPLINKRAETLNITNEAALNGTAFLKNIIGLWLVQESRREWEKSGKSYSYSQLEQMAENAEPFKAFIDPDSPLFAQPGNIPGRIREYCAESKQRIPEGEGEIIRCIYESMAFKYRRAVSELCECIGRDYDTVYMVGGGVKSKMLCGMTANACAKRVSAGPAEASAVGNILIQLIALGEIKNMSEARAVAKGTEELTVYEPCGGVEWEEAYARFLRVLGLDAGS